MAICQFTPDLNMFSNVPTLNERILNTIKYLPDNARKEISLLAKQYDIISITQDDDIINEHEINGNKIYVCPGDYIFEYRNKETGFIYHWIIEGKRLI